MNRPQIRGYRPQVKGYRPAYSPLNVSDIGSMIEAIPTLTKIGGVCLVTGKFFGVLAIPAVFIPALNSVAIFLVIAWGGLVFTSIALCSYEHFREKKVETKSEKMAILNQFISKNPALREQLASEFEQDKAAGKYQIDEHYESQKVIYLSPGINLKWP